MPTPKAADGDVPVWVNVLRARYCPRTAGLGFQRVEANGGPAVQWRLSAPAGVL